MKLHLVAVFLFIIIPPTLLPLFSIYFPALTTTTGVRRGSLSALSCGEEGGRRNRERFVIGGGAEQATRMRCPPSFGIE